MDDTTRGLEIDGVTLALRVTRKRVKNINVRLVGNELRVSAPPWVSRRELDEAIGVLACDSAHIDHPDCSPASRVLMRRVCSVTDRARTVFGGGG